MSSQAIAMTTTTTSRAAPLHPLHEPDGLAQLVADVAGDDGVGRAAQRGAQPADGGGPGDGQHQPDPEDPHRAVVDGVADRGALLDRVALGGRGGRRAAGALDDQPQHAQRDRQHHQGGGRVGHPRAQERGRDHHPRHDPPGLGADRAQRQHSASSAMRRCRFRFCIAMAIRNPPVDRTEQRRCARTPPVPAPPTPHA
jgi:hypothetical protein